MCKENAIIMASGLGSRMRPLTYTTPKPLLSVHGKPMVETIIEGLLRRNIKKIAVVVGYLGEQFKYLEKKYPSVCIIQNTDYETVNNISSVYYARDILRQGDCFICEADLYVADLTILDADLKVSCYYGKMVSGYSNDWGFEQDASGVITHIGKGVTDCYNMVGIAYFKAEDAAVLADSIEAVYGKSGYEPLFWDEVVNNNLGKFKLYIHSVNENQIIEIDTVEELECINKRNKDL